MIGNLSPKQQKALWALLDGKTNEEAAKTAGVNVRTISRWKKEVAFTNEIAKAQDSLHAEGLICLGANEKLALESVIDLAKNAEDDNVRLRAAKELLNQLNSYRERSESIHQIRRF